MRKTVLLTMVLILSILSSTVYATDNDFELKSLVAVTTELANVDIDISLVYDNCYHEKVLQPGKQLTAELTANNSSGEDKTVTLLIALYDDSNKVISIKSASETLINSQETKFGTTIVVPFDNKASSAKVMLWNGFQSMQPYSDPIVLTIENNDYFGDDYSLSQPLTSFSDAKGQISPITDVDVFVYIPAKDGLYIFESYGDTDVYANLYAEGNYTTPIATNDNEGDGNNFRLSCKLVAGHKYYLYINGNETGDYAIKALYAIGNIFGTVSPVKYYDNEPEFNEAIEGKVTLTTYDTNEFVATMHLKEWAVATSEYAAFDMTGIHGGTYLVSITRPGYLTRYRKIVLNDNVIDLGNVALLAGDVDGNGIIETADSTLLQSLYGKEYGQDGYTVAGDLNGDKVINSDDLSLLINNLNKTANAYSENVNVITVTTSLSGSTLTISGTAAADSNVTVNVYQGSTGIFSENVTANASGVYLTTCNLSKAGIYNVVVTSDNRAVDMVTVVNY